MSIPTVWTIVYACGHSEERDLSTKRSDQRAGYVKWLAKRDCFVCYRATHAPAGARGSEATASVA